jgi:hypothetical protein
LSRGVRRSDARQDDESGEDPDETEGCTGCGRTCHEPLLTENRLIALSNSGDRIISQDGTIGKSVAAGDLFAIL